MIPIMSRATNLPDEFLELPATERTFVVGEHLFHRGDKSHIIHQIMEGTAHLIRHHASGKAVILQRAGAGSILAEASLFSEHYHCDAIAVAATRVRSIKKSIIRSKLRESPEFAEALVTFLARQLQSTRLRCEILSAKTVEERLDLWSASNDGNLVGKGEWKAVATEIGTSAEALYRELAKRRQA